MHKHQETILEAIKANPNITNRKLGELIGSDSAGHVQHHLGMLIKAGLIKRGTTWVVVEKSKAPNKSLNKKSKEDL